MMPFFQPDWAGAYWGRRSGDRTAAGLVCRLWIVGPEIGPRLGWFAGSRCGTAGTQALDVAHLCKYKKEEGSAGLRPWPLRCLSQFLAERKYRLLRKRMCLRTFHRWGGLVFIVYVFPNWMVIRILWCGIFIPYRCQINKR